MRNRKLFAALGAVGIAVLIAGCSNAQAGEIGEATDLGTAPSAAVSAGASLSTGTEAPATGDSGGAAGDLPDPSQVSAARIAEVEPVVRTHLLAVGGVEIKSITVTSEQPNASAAMAKIVHNGKAKTIILSVGKDQDGWDVFHAYESKVLG